MTEERTEEQKIFQDGVKVMLGGKEYSIKPLVIRDARQWRSEVAKALGQIPKYVNVDTSKPVEFEQAIKNMLVDMNDTVIDLFFLYAKDLKREEIEAEATEAEIAAAFLEIIKIAFPLKGSLTNLMKPSL